MPRDIDAIVHSIDEHITRHDLVAKGPQIRTTRDGFSARLAADIIGEGTTVEDALSSLLDVLDARERRAEEYDAHRDHPKPGSRGDK